MRFTKFLAATMAAMAITSCSQQELIEGVPLEPGDAQIVLDLGRSFTTYASEAAEKAILNGSAKLYDSSGNSIAWKDGKVTIDNTGKLSGVVEAAVVNKLTDKKVKLLVEANNADKNVTIGTTGTDLEKAEASTSAFDLYTKANQDLTTGILSSGKFELTLMGGPITAATTPAILKRTMSRIYVKKSAGVTASIKDFNIQITGLSQSVEVYKYVGTGGTLGSISHKVTEVQGTDTYNNNEVVGYAYPSTAANISISHGTTGAEMPNVKLEANKNYAIVITPVLQQDAVVDIKFEIVSWDAGPDLDIALQNKVKISDPGIAGVTVTGESVIFPSTGLGGTSAFVTWSNLLNDARFTLDEVIETAAPKTRADISVFYSESADKRLRWDIESANLSIAAMPNTTGKDLIYHLSARTKVDGTDVAKQFTITVPAIVMPNYPGGFTTTFSGIEWMTINTQNTGNGVDDINVFNKVNAMVGTTIIDKLKAYSAVSEVNHNEMSGDFSKYANGSGQTKKAPTCPPGFIVPSIQQLRKGMMNVGSEWTTTTEQFLTVARASFDTFAVPTNPNLTTNRTVFAHNANYKAVNGQGKGYFILKNEVNEEIMIPWRGNLNAAAEDNNHISGLISRTPTPNAAESMRRMVFGFAAAATGSPLGIVDTAVSTKFVVNSSLVRCVKISPETYWDLHK